MSEHTQGRLKSIGNNLHQETGRFKMANAITACGAGGNIMQDVHASIANARRLAAAWNAFEGVTTFEINELLTGELGGFKAFAVQKYELIEGLEKKLNAAHALLREVSDKVALHGLNSYEWATRIREYLDACDTLEGK